MPTKAQEENPHISLIPIRNSSIVDAVAAVHSAQQRLRFSLYGGRLISGGSELVVPILDALQRIVIGSDALKASIISADDLAAPEPTPGDDPWFIAVDENAGLSVEIGFAISLEDGLAWTAKKYELFQSVGPDSKAQFYLAFISSGDLLLSLATSHVLFDGKSLQLFWRQLANQLAPMQEAHVNPLASKPSVAFSVLSQGSHGNAESLDNLSPSDSRYWEWISRQLLERTEDFGNVPYQRSCRFHAFRETSEFAQELRSYSKNDYTYYENYVAFFAKLVFEHTDCRLLHVQCPVSLRRADEQIALGYYIDSRPIFIEREDYDEITIHDVIRSSLKRLVSLPIPWRDYVMNTFSVSPDKLRKSNGILISEFYKPEKTGFLSQDSQPISEHDLRTQMKTKYTVKAGRRAITDLFANCSYQVCEDEIMVLSNVSFISQFA